MINPVVLLVEDNASSRYLAKVLLEREGLRVIEAHDGRAALDVALRERPDLVVMDIQRPEMDGYEAAARIRSHADLAAVPIVGVSSYATGSDRARALASVFVGYLDKPIDPSTCARDIARFLPPERTR